MRRSALLPVVAVAALVLAGCGGGSLDLDFPELPSTTPTTSTTTLPDYSGVQLAGVPGSTSTLPIDNSPGQASISGVVNGPDGTRVGGAVVRVQRLVGDQAVTNDIVANADGTWRVANVKGGRYRIRAWRAPDLHQAGAAVFYLGGTEKRNVPLALDATSGTVVRSSIAPNPPRVGELANLIVLVATRVVDDNGIVRASGIADTPVTLYATGSVSLRTPNPAVTDGSGEASWQLVCRAAGDPGRSSGYTDASGQTQLQALAAGACTVPAPPSTAASSSTTSPSATTTTSRAGRGRGNGNGR